LDTYIFDVVPEQSFFGDLGVILGIILSEENGSEMEEEDFC
jgi:hypothetical protein